jgi:hypothetical protein
MTLLAPEVVEAAPNPTRVVEALETTRRAMRRYRRAMVIAGAILTALAMASVVAVADVSWVLPAWSRAVALAGIIVSSMVMIARHVLARGPRFGQGEAAAEVESAFPELGQRVRTTLEYSEPRPDSSPASASLIGALVKDTDRRADGLEFPAIVPWSRFRTRMLGLSGAILAILVALAYEPTLRIAARRVLLLPVHYTTLAVEPGNRTLREGAVFTLRATLTGRPVSDARWLQRPAGSHDAWTATPLRSVDSPRSLIGTLEAVRKDCRADFDYRVVAGEVESDVFRVTVTHPLRLKSLEAAIEPPAYTRSKPSVSKEGNFRVPEGSKVGFRIDLDRAPASARIAWTPEGSKSPRTLPLSIQGQRLSGQLPPLDKDVSYEIVANSADGMKLESARFAIGVQPDEKPTVKFIKPAESHAATPTTEVPMQVEAGDDYGVAKVGMVYQVGDGPEETLYLDDPKDLPRSVEALATLYLEKHKLTYTDSLTYRAFVEDNRTPGPHRVSTELRFIDIVPYKQAFQLVEGGGSCNGSSVTLEELILRQRAALNRAFAHAEDQPIEPKVADRLSREEAELALVTDDFARKLASEFGPISPLEDAARAMEMATVSLGSKELAASIPLEQSALTALIKARQNLRKLMSTSSSGGQCRKIDRQQLQQKLRKPPAAEKSKEAELARLEQDLKKLAQDQKNFAEEIDPKGGDGAELDRKDEPRAGQPSKNSGTKPSPAERQQASSKEADRLNALAGSDRALTDLARGRMDEATREVKEAEAAIKADRPRESAQSARSAAEHLERLAEQVAGLKAKELAARIARARDLAQSTARDERELAGRAKPGEPGEALARQQGLAEDARTLADLLRQLRSDAVEEDRKLAQAVAKASEANSPAEIERVMRRASASIASGEPEKSSRSMGEAAGKLDALARDLESARRDFMQPKLQQLIAAEKKAAEAQRSLDSASSEARKAEAEKAVSELARAVESLKPGEGSLRKAADVLSQVAQGGASGGWAAPAKVGPRAGLFTPPISHTNAVRAASQALQAKIQELILDDALVDRDGPVPPGYKEKVEDYFRVLSEDLR